MAEDLTELKERVQLARADISDINELCGAYVRSFIRVEEQRFESGPFTSSLFITAQALQPIPTKIKVAAGKVLNELRATLDNLACVLAVRNNQDPGEQTYFPISKTEEIFIADGLKRKLKLVSEADKQTIASLQPFKGGHPHLYQLHQADKMRKHQRLTAQTAGNAGASVGGMLFPPGTFMTRCTINGHPVDALSIGEPNEPRTILPGPPVQVAWASGSTPPVVPHFQIGFEEPEEVAGCYVVPILGVFANTVEEVISLFD
jgi:hypothetical protein